MYRGRYHHDLLSPGLPNNHFLTKANIYDFHVDPTHTKLAQNNVKAQGPLILKKKLSIEIKKGPFLASLNPRLTKLFFVTRLTGGGV